MRTLKTIKPGEIRITAKQSSVIVTDLAIRGARVIELEIKDLFTTAAARLRTSSGER
jgi:hypothetical protein